MAASVNCRLLSTCLREENEEKIKTPHCANRQRFYPDIFMHKFQSVIATPFVRHDGVSRRWEIICFLDGKYPTHV